MDTTANFCLWGVHYSLHGFAEAVVRSRAMDDLVVERAARGDRRAAQAVLSRLLPRVRVLVRYLVGGASDADDMVQDSLVEILRSLRTFRGESSLETWSDRITSRCVFAALKKRRSQPAVSMDLVDEPVATGVTADEQEMRRRYLGVLDRLPEEQRLVLVLHHMAEMTVEEISSSLSVPHETVRTRLRRGKERLRSLRGSTDGGRDD